MVLCDSINKDGSEQLPFKVKVHLLGILVYFLSFALLVQRFRIMASCFSFYNPTSSPSPILYPPLLGQMWISDTYYPSLVGQVGILPWYKLTSCPYLQGTYHLPFLVLLHIGISWGKEKWLLNKSLNKWRECDLTMWSVFRNALHSNNTIS